MKVFMYDSRRSAIQLILSVSLLSLLASVAWGYSSGPLNGLCNDPPFNNNCTQCHGSYPLNSGDGVLQLVGLPTAYQPDSLYTLGVTLVDTGQIRWGFELTVILNNNTWGGTLASEFPALVQISTAGGDTMRDYAKHTTLGTYEGAPAAAWVILWTAPPAGSDSVHFYLAGNAANGNGTNQGDYIYTISVHVPELILGVEEQPGLPPPTALLTWAYPNPFNPMTAIGYQLSAPGFVELRVFDTAGKQVATLVEGRRNAGRHQVTFDGSDLPSGIYIYRLTAGNFAATDKMVLLK
jgi:hypothetical protein